MNGDFQPTKGQRLHIPAVLFALLLGFHAILGIHWIRSDQGMRGIDEIDYLMFLQRFEVDVSHGNPSFLQQVRIAFWDSPRLLPGFSFGLAKAAYQIFGRSLATARLVSFVCFLALMILLFLFGREIGGAWCGLIASALFSFFPYAFLNARHFNLFAISALAVTLTIWLLTICEGLTRWPVVLCLGPAAGCAALAERGIPPLILAGPALFILASGVIVQGRISKRLVLRPLLLGTVALALALIISGPYLYDYFVQSLAHNIREITSPQFPSHPVYHFYFTTGIAQLIGLPMVLLISFFSVLLLGETSWKMLVGVIGLGFLLWLLKFNNLVWIALWGAIFLALLASPIRHRGILLAWLVTPLVIFSFFETKYPHYLFNLMPALALAAGAMIVHKMDTLLRRAVVVVVLVGAFAFSTVQMIALSFDNGTAKQMYEAIPPPLRATGFDITHHHSIKGHRETAREILTVLPDAGRGGLLVHLPGVWSPVKKSKVEPNGITTEIMWGEQVQVWMNYARPDIGHLIFHKDLVAAMPWADPSMDTFAWLPSAAFPPEEESGRILFSRRPEPFIYLEIDSPEDRMKVDEILGELPPLPGQTLANWPFTEGTTIRLTRLIPAP